MQESSSLSDYLVRPATVMNPRQLHAQALTMKQDASIINGHALAITLPNSVVQQFELSEPTVRVRLTLYPSPLGVMVLCLTIQVGGTQVRTLADCRDQRVRAWLEWLAINNSGRWLFEVEETQQVVWVQCEVPVPSVPELMHCAVQSVQLDDARQASEFAFVAMELSRPDAIDSLVQGQPVTTTAVAWVVPSAMGGDAMMH